MDSTSTWFFGGRSRTSHRYVMAVATVLSWKVAAPAQIVASATLIKDPAIGIPFNAPDAALGSPWVSYKLSVAVTFGILEAFDVSIDGPLHQRWDDTNSDGTFEPTVVGTEQSSGDSHLLIPAGSLFGFLPTEDNPGTGSPLASTFVSKYGIGSSLHGAWAPAAAVQSADVAYIVVPKGSERSLEIQVLAADPADPTYRLTTKDFFPVPEPARIMLALVAGAALTGIAWRQTRHPRAHETTYHNKTMYHLGSAPAIIRGFTGEI
jgi:hypothetical protein